MDPNPDPAKNIKIQPTTSSSVAEPETGTVGTVTFCLGRTGTGAVIKLNIKVLIDTG
jgi:hypothetical protein